MEEEIFSSAAEARQFPVKGSASYIGGVHELWEEHWNVELKTAEPIRTGILQTRYDYAAMSKEELATCL